MCVFDGHLRVRIVTSGIMAKDSQDGWDEVFGRVREWIEHPPSNFGEAVRRLRRLPTRMVKRERRNPLVYSAFLGVAVLAVIQLLPLAELDWPLTFSVISFAISVPLLAGTVYIINTSRRADYEYEVETWGTFLMDLAGILLNLGGIMWLFWHLWWAAGVLFFLSSAVAFAIFIHYLNAFGEVNAAEVDLDAEKAAGLRQREEPEEQGEA